MTPSSSILLLLLFFFPLVSSAHDITAHTNRCDLSEEFAPEKQSKISVCGGDTSNPQQLKSVKEDIKVLKTADPQQLKSAREDIKKLLKAESCHPLLVRLGWHDAGTYDRTITEWPQRGGADGSVRFATELKHIPNGGLIYILNVLQPIKDKYPGVSYADLFQLGSATAIEEAGGPKIRMKYGRVDVTGPDQCPEEGRLPEAHPVSAATHLRDFFDRMGFNDKELVALSGAHTLGRSFVFGKRQTKYTKEGPGTPGGMSWTVEWLRFDNSYFKDIKEPKDKDLIVLPTDAILFEDPDFKKFAEIYAEDQDAFFEDYAEAHSKLSDLGAKFDPPEGFTIDDDDGEGEVEVDDGAEPPIKTPEKFAAPKHGWDRSLV